MKVAISTLGCRTNQLESSVIADEFNLNGWEVVSFEEVADVYIINTCSVTSKSDSTSRNIIRKAHRLNPAAKVVVTGCYAQVASGEIVDIEGVSLIIGNPDKNNIFNLVSSHMEKDCQEVVVRDIMQVNEFSDKNVFSALGRARANVKIQDGCNNRCSYCIVPFGRGPSRSNKPENIVKQVTEIAPSYPEIVLTATHVGQYGLELNPKTSLVNLLQELVSIKSLHRIRLGSIDPLEITDDLISFIATNEKICRYTHISIQSANNTILKEMNRHYTFEEYEKIIAALVEKVPGIAIGSDVIVGFPGETDDLFEDTYNNLVKLPLSYMHVFSYSPRKGTKAATMPNQVDPKRKKQRNQRLQELSAQKNYDYRKQFLGKTLQIIPEFTRDKETNRLKGLSDTFISVYVEAEDSVKGSLLPVKITSVEKDRTFGELVKF